MASSNGRIAGLIIKFHQEQLSAEEELELNAWMEGSEERRRLFGELTESEFIREQLEKMERYDESAIRTKVSAAFPAAFEKESQKEPAEEMQLYSGRSYRWTWARAAAAAVLLLLLGSGTYFLIFRKTPVSKTIAVTAVAKLKNDVMPGTKTATLTLANGSVIQLDSAAAGTLAKQGRSNVLKTGNGRIQYQLANNDNAPVSYNVLEVPRGSQVVQLSLSDGSRVWMNAASSIKYPTAFTGKERMVEITGEAYFEVTHNSKMPFRVKAGEEVVEDLGTHFNVNSYGEEEEAQITLLEGSVRINGKNNTKILKPGQQALIGKTGNISLNQEVDTIQVMAWKNGRFKFNGNSIQSVMRQIERWYDVKVNYEGDPPPDNFMGGVSREGKVSEVLKMLELTNAVHFRIEEGHRIIVSR